MVRLSRLDTDIHRKTDISQTAPVTRYYGSKRKLLNWIASSLDSLDYVTVLDAFGGTGSVSYMFKFLGKKVFYNDGLQSNCVMAKSVLSSSPTFTEGEMTELLLSIRPRDGIISKHYDNLFYTPEENNWLDGILSEILYMDEEKKNEIYYSLFQACLMKRPYNLFHRANLNLRTNPNVMRRFGNASTWNRKFDELLVLNHKRLHRAQFDGQHHAEVLQPSDAFELPTGFDLVYLDPPYIGKGSKVEGYFKRYHFLETLLNYQEVEKIVDLDSRIKTPNLESKMVDAWVSPRLFKDKLFGLVEKHKKSIVVLSYVDNAVPTIDEINVLFKSYFRKVVNLQLETNHALSSRRKMEQLFIGIP